MIKEAILKVYKHENLTYDEAYQTMDECLPNCNVYERGNN